MNWLDGITAAYLAFGAARGRKRGLPEEAYRCVRLLAGLGAGCGLYGLISDAVSAVASVAPEVSAPAGFLATFGGAFALLHLVRRKIIETVRARFASLQAVGGAVAGALQAFMVIVSLVTAVQLSSSTPDQGVAADSFIGRIVRAFTPDRSVQAEAEPKQEQQHE
ncbi:MAG: CvpA family protein [bacterium]